MEIEKKIEGLLERGVAIIVQRNSKEEQVLVRMTVSETGVTARRTRYFHEGRWLMSVFWRAFSAARRDTWQHHPKSWWLGGEFYLLPDPETFGTYDYYLRNRPP